MIPTDLWQRLTADDAHSARVYSDSEQSFERVLAAERDTAATLRERIRTNHPGGLTTSSPGEDW